MMKALMMGFALSVLISTTCSAKEVIFYVGQGHNEWALNVVGKGKAVVGDTLIYAEYEYIKLTNNPKHNKNRTVEYISFDYAYALPNGGWDIKSTGLKRAVNRELKPNEWMTVNWVDSKLKLDGPTSKYWLVVTIATNEGLVHAHSRRDIFEQ